MQLNILGRTEKIKEEITANPFPVRYVEFSTCQELYAKHSTRGPSGPLTGVKFNVAYIDTDPEAEDTKPVIVCLHGCPGGHWDFNHLTIHLAQKGYRIVIPNFPGYGWTDLDENRVFQGSIAEMAYFVKDFLATLGIAKVHMGIVHSAAAYHGVLLASINLFQSMALINPGGLAQVKFLKPYSFWQTFHYWYHKNPISHSLLLLFGKAVMFIMGISTINAEQMGTALGTFLFIPYDELKVQIESLTVRKFPSVLIHSLNDQLVQYESVLELGALLAGSEEHLQFVYDQNGLLSSIENSNRKIAHAEHHIFNSGGHFLMKKYPAVVNEIIEKFLKQVESKLLPLARL